VRGSVVEIVLALIATFLILAVVDPNLDLLKNEPLVRFAQPFRYDPLGHDIFHLNDEVVTLENPSTEPLDMSGWRLMNERRNMYRFPEGFILAPGAYVTIHSGCGDDTQYDLYWCSSMPIWNDEQGEAFLARPGGRVVARYPYGQPCETCGQVIEF
jgi:hypothetical protein